MRILFVTETFPPEINGVAMTTGRMVAGLRAKQHWVGVIRPRQHRNEQVDPSSEWLVPGYSLPNYPEVKLGFPAWNRLRRIMGEQGPDVVHIVTEGPLGWAALLAARHLGIPVTSGYHTHFDQYSSHYGMRWFGPMVTWYLDALHRRCQATLVPAPELAKSLQRRGLPNVHVVGRGVDTGLFDPARRDPALRAEWGLPQGSEQGSGPACLYVGRIAPEKNLDTVVLAFEAIAAKHPGARMIWVGNGPSLGELRKKHPRHVFAGPRMGLDLARHYASADLFLFASLSETWGNVIGEAMASGLGVVAYRRAAGAALIRHGVNGLAPLEGHQGEFINSALHLADDSALRAAVSAMARQSMLESLGWDAICNQMEKVLSAAAHPTRT